MAGTNGSLSAIKNEITALERELSLASSQDEAMKTAMAAASLCLRALKLSTDDPEKTSLRSQATSFITAAESIKNGASWKAESSGNERPGIPQQQRTRRLLTCPVNKRPLTTKEQTLVLKASFVNGNKFPPWVDTLNSDLFQSSDGTNYTDKAKMQLSSQQHQYFDKWDRAINALTVLAEDGRDTTLCMTSALPIDLVQDVASDCSVIASLCVIADREERGHPSLLTSIIHPTDAATGLPAVSPNGCYVVKLYFNGAWRFVRIDDNLPVSKSQRLLHTVDLNCPALLWPALVEKAYLKVRGGYDFPGSNTCTDLWALTGWIPEQIFIRDEDTDLDQLWSRIEKSQVYGDVMISLGTGQMSRVAEQAEQLASEHSYAVLGLFVEDGVRKVKLKNPWRDSTAARVNRAREGATSLAALKSDNPPREKAVITKDQTTDQQGSAAKVSGVSTLTYDNILQNFESIYLNWNPGLFNHRCEIHFSWTLHSIRSKNANFVDSPQFALAVSSATDLWLLLCKHLPTDRTAEKSLDSVETSNASRMGDQNGFLSLYALSQNGYRVRTTKGLIKRSPYVDSSQVLLKLSASANTTYTLVTSEQDMSAGSHTFTLIAFSHKPVALEQAQDLYSSTCEVKSAWNVSTAGGNGQCPNFTSNPQFRLSVSRRTRLAMILEVENQSYNVNAKLLYGGGKRVAAITKQSIIVDSGDYRGGSCFAEVEEVEPGEYTIICSTFEAGQEGRFKLRVDSECDCRLIKLPGEHVDRFRVDTLGAAHFAPGISKMVAPLHIRRMMKMTVVAQATSMTIDGSVSRHTSRSPIRVSIDVGRGENAIHHAASCDGEFSSADYGVKTNDVDLWQDMAAPGADLWLVLERLVSPVGGSAESYKVELLVDCKRGEGWDVGQWRSCN